MPVTVIVGAQVGDEGKGHIVDYLAQNADIVWRFQGGDNAGHTTDPDDPVKHLIPSGISNRRTKCVIGTGTVVYPPALIEEMAAHQRAGVILDNLSISSRAHMLMPHHRELDAAMEELLGEQKIGTTKRGIGPAYADKALRIGLRIGDLKHPEYLRKRLETILPQVKARLAQFGKSAPELEEILAWCKEWHGYLGSRIIDTTWLVQEALDTSQEILFEGQLGIMRDVDWGTYPFVTSSHPLAAYAAISGGFSPKLIDNIIGVAKAYSTAVGAGPFPTELTDEVGAKLREIGHEYGATTGRPRRVGWFDAVVVRYAKLINGLTSLALTKLDVLDSFPEINICTGYELPDGDVEHRMVDMPELEIVRPIYITLPGWMTSTRDAKSWNNLPLQAQDFINRISELCDIPIKYVSVGPKREQIFKV